MPGVEHPSGTAVNDPAWSAAGILEKLDRLATCTEQEGEITRLFLTPEHARAIDMLRPWMRQAGLQTLLDPSGTLIGTLPAASPGAPKLLLGSHIDTVRNAGRYDGCLGVLAGIALAARLRDAHLPYTLEIRAFGDEEGVRFPVTLTGAHAAAGTFNALWLSAQDAEGTTLGEALEEFGLDREMLVAGACTAAGAFAYLEIHIEQGPVLEAANLPVGVVTAINGATRWELKVTGKAGHAGTVPMARRQDALAAAAAMILAAQRIALGRPNVVATIGRIAVSPGATNVIPGECIFTLDLRAPDDDLRDAAEREIFAAFRQTAEATATTLAATRLHDAPATACDPRLQACIAAAITAAGLPVLQLPSGAGHDAMAVASLCPVGMLFVRCAGGISHHPDEAVSESDVAIALDVMAATLHHIDPADFIPQKAT
jgi:allantoate deiminase